jgi:hypothetical protein
MEGEAMTLAPGYYWVRFPYVDGVGLEWLREWQPARVEQLENETIAYLTGRDAPFWMADCDGAEIGPRIEPPTPKFRSGATMTSGSPSQSSQSSSMEHSES